MKSATGYNVCEVHTMFRRFYFVLTALLAFGTAFAACSKQAEPVTENQNLTTPPAKAKPEPVCTSPSDAQAAIDALLEVMSAVADTNTKETCDEIVEALKALNNDDIRAKTQRAQTLDTCPKDVREAIVQANGDRLLAIRLRAADFAKCEDTPQSDEILRLIHVIRIGND